MKYRPCTGACTHTGTHCDGCGRSHEEVAQLNRMIKDLAAYAKKMDYENIEDYANSVAKGIYYKLESLNQ
jgi:hypothetical protein